MTTEIRVLELPARRLLMKKTTCRQDAIGPAFAQAVGSVGRCFKASSGEMRSAPVAVYFEWREVDCDMAAGCEVEGEIILSEGCEWIDLVGGPHATATHFGPYDSLGETHTAIIGWVKASADWTFNGPCSESYPVDPSLEPDKSRWQTDVAYPVKPR